jgi:arylsulfatase A-like enzyme
MTDMGLGTRPNIVFVFADDWGWGDLGCYGHPHIRTPNLDQLASQGTLFSQFYVCSGVCSPSRAAAMTSRFPGELGIHGHFADPDRNARRAMPGWLDPDVMTYARLLSEAGYAVGHYGKWHLGHDPDAPAPTTYGVDECRINVGNGPPLTFSDVGYNPARYRSSEVIVDEAIGFVQRHQAEPFLVNVWLNDTHATLDPSEEQLRPFRDFMPSGLGHRYPGALAVYYSVVHNADYHIGRLVEWLDELGLGENTVVIFSADNGPEDILIRNASHSGVGSPGPFRGRKRSLYEGGVRTPFIVRWPAGQVQRGTVDDETVLSAVDLLPTFSALAGIELPEGIGSRGENMVGAFRGIPQLRETPLYWEWRFRVVGHVLNRSPVLAVRRGDYKLLLNPDRGRVELYHVPSDPLELENLAGDRLDIVDSMAEEVLSWQAGLPAGPMDIEAGSNVYSWPGTF